MIAQFFYNHLEPLAVFYFTACAAVIYGYFYAKYKIDKLQFFHFDGRLSKFEKDFLIEFPKYFLWASAQQFLVIGMVELSGADGIVAVACAIILFGGVHLPNINLTIITLMLGAMIYPTCFLYKNLFMYFALLHALGGTLGKLAKWEMRVLWNYPKHSR